MTLVGDNSIRLRCEFGECLSSLSIPDEEAELPAPLYPSTLSVVLMLGSAALLLAVVFGGVLIARKQQEKQKYESLEWYRQNGIDYDGGDGDLEEDMRKKLMMAGHVPMNLQFANLSYVVDLNKRSGNGSIFPKIASLFGRRASNLSATGTEGTSNTNEGSDSSRLVVLEGVHGNIRPGEVLAIMGGSGAGKTTFLDILARKNKTGTVMGDIFINGKKMSDGDYKKIIGYVDQEDCLMDTLTVYEAILYSALLRLPTDMPLRAKKFRVQETMMELGISAIANRKIGKEGNRGISGGEKRRVSIACELVTSPSILFLDEPTSGLDSFNAYNVVESLVSLARYYQRTIITTIHQPRSNIYALFDQLILLAKGRLVYSGPAQKEALDHFAKLGFHCPLGFNTADYLGTYCY